MISSKNIPISDSRSESDFTTTKYSDLCRLALKSYTFAKYTDIPWGQRFILWRHDIDFSLNRGLALAKIEHDLGIKATYFINPHSEFYNLAEASQYEVVREILALGHDIGLHFDVAFFGEISAEKLDSLVAYETAYLEWLFEKKPVAFSFHAPTSTTLKFEKETYGGLINCYSEKFKESVPYCSDSNGYWRFRRLYDVLTEAKDPCLQVLTHPGWWQDDQMAPFQRVSRCVYGRAAATIRTYKAGIEKYGRLNHSGSSLSLEELISPLHARFELCNYLLNQGEFELLFIELWRIHEAQVNRLCKAKFCKEWAVPVHEVNTFFSSNGLRVTAWNLFNAAFEIPWANAAGVDEVDNQFWQHVRNQVTHGRSSISSAELEMGCFAICGIISRLAKWGREQSIGFDGLEHLGSIGLSTVNTANGSLAETLEDVKENVKAFPSNRWVEFKEKLTVFEKPEDK